MTPHPILRAALHAADRGWPVFPVGRQKRPITRHGHLDATTDRATIAAWWRRTPSANYGISTGPAGLVVVDLDAGKGPVPARVLPDQGDDDPRPTEIDCGADVLSWAAERDRAEPGWAATLTVATPSGGWHMYYSAPPEAVIRSSTGSNGGRLTGLGWSIDVRAAGGYAVGPGSAGYRVVVAGAVQSLPGWLASRIAAIGTGQPTTAMHRGAAIRRPGPAAGTRYALAAVAGELEAIAAAELGGRNQQLNRSAFKLGRLVDVAGLDPDDVGRQLVAAGIAIGLPEREAVTAVRSGLGQGRANPQTLTTR